MIAIVALVIAVVSTVAWFVLEGGITSVLDFTISNFAKPTADVYFLQGDLSTVNADIYQNSDGTITVDFENSSANNYIEKLRVDVNYTGKGEAYIRVKMLHQFIKTEVTDEVSYDFNAELPYTIDTLYTNSDYGNKAKWYDNRKNDLSFYYATAVYTQNNNTSAKIPLITGFNAGGLEPSLLGSTLKIAIEVEAVQINRYPQLWGINKLPWPGANSGSVTIS